ncbi:unnamed protein product [Arabidopsis thaliana]|uniref:Paired amphipathic helix (PAH2) superfamily protein n=2 Tax=Arabidopsis thaliana TaxID=3702 RepID=A0A654G155_ARATH|nr:unnamed protein product [Arabidopsis thaliana]
MAPFGAFIYISFVIPDFCTILITSRNASSEMPGYFITISLIVDVLISHEETERTPDEIVVPRSPRHGGNIERSIYVDPSLGMTISDARAYLQQVKNTFIDHDERDKYAMFRKVLFDFKAQRIDRSILYARLKKLFKKHKHLIIGFNTFLSLGDKIFLHGDAEASTSSTA